MRIRYFSLPFPTLNSLLLKASHRMEGFIVFDYAKRYPEARKELAQWLSEGKVQRKETIIKGGLVKSEQALIDLYDGVNTGEPLRLFSGHLDEGIGGGEATRLLNADLTSGKLLVEVCPEDRQAKANL